MIAAIKMRFSNTSIVTPRLLAHSRRNVQSLGAMSLGVSFTVAKGVSPCVLVIVWFCMVDSCFLTGIGVGCVRAGECLRTCQPALFGGCGPL
jgi:hypothetical protein